MSETKAVWQVSFVNHGKNNLLTDDLNELADVFDFAESSGAFEIARVEMTQEEFDALDDFGGF